ncbi:MAG TPA: carboxypeptidase-like regulatory domain-containing protein [Thermoleophilaceae bacterium]
MNPNRTEDVTPIGLAAADLGEATTQAIAPPINDEWSLISYLTSPLEINSRQDYVVISSADSVPVGSLSTTPDLTYTWTATNTDNGFILKHETTEDGVFYFMSGRPGNYEVKVVVTTGDTEVVTLTLNQQVEAPSQEWEQTQAELESNTAPKSQIFAMREICIEMNQYIKDAAASTGPNGVPALLVAAVLFMEAFGRPKDGSPGADAIRKKLAGSDYSPREDALKEKIQRFLGQGHYHLHLHDIREEELKLIREFLNEWNGVDRKYMGGKTIGLGQIAMTTTSMITGDTPWTELNESKRVDILDQIEKAWRALTIETKVDIFNDLRFPKRNAWVAAHLLAQIKNRSHRFPSMTAQDVLSSVQAVTIIATEYNRGAYDTPLSDMKINFNGNRAKQIVIQSDKQIGIEKYF